MSHVSTITHACLFVFFFILSSIILNGCGTKYEIIYKTEYKEVAIPQPCDATKPDRPIAVPDNFNITLNRVLTYTETLEALLDYCTYGKNTNKSNQ